MSAFFKRLALSAFVLLGISTAAAMATPMTTTTYDISGTFNGGGSFSGTFTASGTVNGNDVYTSGTVTGANINVTSNTIGAYTFASVDYGNPASNYTIAGTLQQDFFEVDSTNGADNFRVYFSNAGLSTTGATIVDGSSYDYQNIAGNRTFASATLTAQVPEPSSFALLGTAMGLLACVLTFGRKRRPLLSIA